MRLHGVPATSANYEVWLAYRLGRNASLRDEIDQRIAPAKACHEEFNAELYERYFTAARASAQIVMAGEHIARDLNHVLSFMQAAEERSGDYGRTLEIGGDRSQSRPQPRSHPPNSVRAWRRRRSTWPTTINTSTISYSAPPARSIRCASALNSVRVELLTDSPHRPRQPAHVR